MSYLQIEGINKHFKSFSALKDINVSIPTGSLLCLLGPSGCGKTTLLRIIAGLETPDCGQVFLGNTNLLNLPPHKRDIGMVFQSHALFPHLNVSENIEYGLRIGGVSKFDRQQRVSELLELIQLPDAADKPISQLSGGEQQRVAIARALARRPTLFLLDEPTSALDANLRETMQIELRRLQQSLGITTIVVTHDQSEAMTISDLIAVMQQGTIEQFGAPLEIYENPSSEFVANFIGTMNFLNCSWKEGCAHFGNIRMMTGKQESSKIPDGSLVKVAIRPEKVVLADAESGTGNEPNRLRGEIEFVRNTGSLVEIHIACNSAKIIHVFSPQTGSDRLNASEGDRVSAYLPPEHCLLYPE